ncbi:MAG TPA: cytochrome P450 [Sphingobium sp.]
MQAPADIAKTIVDPTAYQDGRIHDALAWLRKEAPVAKIVSDAYSPFWIVTRHADVMEAELRAADFSSGDKPVTLPSDDAAMAKGESTVPVARTLVNMDGAEHRAFRKLAQGYFMPQNLRKLEGRIRQLARRSVDHMASLGGECDFVKEVALDFPLRVIMEILGIPEEDEGLMMKMTQEMFGGEDKDLSRDGAQGDAAAIRAGIRAAVIAQMPYFIAMIEDRKANPRDDLASIIANGEVNGSPIGMAEAIGYYIITATAGHDTTSNTTAGGLWALAERPELLAELKADPSLIPGHVDESVRWASSVRHFMRGATADVQLGGTQIAKGDWVMLSYLSANRDESVFTDPFTYDVRRPANKHIAFGYGPHVCIGQHLGRMEMRIFWEELLPRLSSLELADTAMLSAATFVGGPKHVPIRYTMA